jgi:hypothetical protein
VKLALTVLLAAVCALAVVAESGRLDVAKTESQYGVKIQTTEKVVTVTVGDTLNGEVTDPAKVAAAGFEGAQKGDQLKLIYGGKNTFTAYLSRTNKVGRMILGIGSLEMN